MDAIIALLKNFCSNFRVETKSTAINFEHFLFLKSAKRCHRTTGSRGKLFIVNKLEKKESLPFQTLSNLTRRGQGARR